MQHADYKRNDAIKHEIKSLMLATGRWVVYIWRASSSDRPAQYTPALARMDRGEWEQGPA